MSVHTDHRRRTPLDLAAQRRRGERIAVLTAYEASFARLCDAAGVDALIVGDSLGMVVQGHDSTLPVRLEDMAYHVACVRRGSERALIVADMPFGSFQESPALAYRNGVRLMQAGAQMVKIEGGAEMVPTTRFLVERGIPVCGHVGLTPQAVHVLGGYRVQGRDENSAARLIADARAQQAAGAALLVVEAVPAALGAELTAALDIPTIGIGAGPDCSGQVLVLHDILAISSGRQARFVRNFMAGAPSIAGALDAFVAAVRDGSYPAPEHCY